MVSIIKSFKQEVKEKIRNKLPNVISLAEDGWNCNVILRTELYYCQPYVKDLFKAISNKYSRNRKKSSDN